MSKYLLKSQPLWMPQGSVRGIIALAFTFGTILSFFVLPLEQSTGLVGLTGIIVKSYFDDRKGSTDA